MNEYTTTTEPETTATPEGWQTAPTSTEDSPPAEAPAVSPPAEVKPSHILLLPPALAGLAKVCAEHSRYALCGVRLSRTGPNRYRAEATDGKCLARVDGEHDNPEDYPAWPELEGAPNGSAAATVPAAAWQAAFKAIPKAALRSRKRVLAGVAAVLGADVVTLASTDLDTRNLSQPRLLDGRWPATDEVFPKKAPKATVKVNAVRLAELLKVAAAFGPGEVGDNAITLEVYGDGKPMVLRTSNGAQTFSGLIMPLS